MVRDIADGYLIVTERTFLRFDVAQLDQIGFEFDRYMRELRSDQPALDDMPAIQKKNRKILKLTQGFTILKNVQARRRSRIRPTGPTG